LAEWEIVKKSDLTEYLSSLTQKPEPLIRALCTRGHDRFEKVSEFLNPTLEFANLFEKFAEVEKMLPLLGKFAQRKGKCFVPSTLEGIFSGIVLKNALGFSPENLKLAQINKISFEIDGEEFPFLEEKFILNTFTLCIFYILAQIEDFNEVKIACDIETTGFSPRTSEIIEIGGVKFQGFKILDSFSKLIKPRGGIPPQITQLTGLRDSDFLDTEPREKVLKDFFDWVGSHTLVFHNANFDLSFLNSEIAGYLGEKLNNKIIDTLKISRVKLPFQSHKLEALKDLFKIEGLSHRAYDDAVTCMKIYNILTYLENPKLKIFMEENLPVVAVGLLCENYPLVDEARWIVREETSLFKKTHLPFLKVAQKELNLETCQADEILAIFKPFLKELLPIEVLSLLLQKSKSDVREFFRKRQIPQKFVLKKEAQHPLKIDFIWDEWFEKNFSAVYENLQPFGRGNPHLKVLLEDVEKFSSTKEKNFFIIQFRKNGKIFNILSDKEIEDGIYDIVFHIEKIRGKFYFLLEKLCEGGS